MDFRYRLFVAALLLAIYRLGLHISVPGVNHDAWTRFVSEWDVACLEILNLLTGPGFQWLSICALGLAPCLLGMAISGRTRSNLNEDETNGIGTAGWSCILLTGLLGGLLGALLIEHIHHANPDLNLVAEPGWSFRLVTAALIGAGSLLVGGVVDQFNSRGPGMGVSILMASNVVSAMPELLEQILKHSDSALLLALLASLTFVSVAAIVFFDGAYRYVSIRHDENRIGNQTVGGQTGHLPFKLMFNGYLPVVLALFSTVLVSSVLGLLDASTLEAGSWSFILVFAALTFLFNALLTAFEIDPMRMASGLSNAGALLEVEGESDLGSTEAIARHIDQLVHRMIAVSAVVLVVVAILPVVIYHGWEIRFQPGGVSLIVIVFTVLRLRDRLNEAR